MYYFSFSCRLGLAHGKCDTSEGCADKLRGGFNLD